RRHRDLARDAARAAPLHRDRQPAVRRQSLGGNRRRGAGCSRGVRRTPHARPDRQARRHVGGRGAVGRLDAGRAGKGTNRPGGAAARGPDRGEPDAAFADPSVDPPPRRRGVRILDETCYWGAATSWISAFFQVSSGLNFRMAKAMERVFGPRSFSYTMPSWLTMKVITPRGAVLRGERDQREPRDHVAACDVVVLAIPGGGPLRGQNPVEIAVERRRPARCVTLVAFGPRPNDQVAQRAERLTGLRGPVKPVAFARSAGELLRVLEDAVAPA